MPLANYSTQTDALQSIAEIRQMLVQFGASRIAEHYQDGKTAGIEFAVKLDGQPLEFRLPVDVKAAFKVLQTMKVTSNQKRMAHAEKVAWRILRDWVRIQLSIVEMKQAELAQVFLPYALMAPDTTVFQGFRLERNRQLGAGN